MPENFELLDFQIFRLFNQGLSSPYLDYPMYVLTWLGSVPFALAFAVVTLFIDRRWGMKNVLTLAFLGTIFETAKVIINRTRPYVSHEAVMPFPPDWFTDPSFPSGHAALAMGIAYLLSQRFERFSVWFYTLACVIALSRIYLGMHYPSEVLVGAILGWMIPFLLNKLYFSRRENR
jgi:undecaprenyl-diphosphatase